VGREDDLRALRCALEEGQRLLTIRGGPGVGKTRLAIEAVGTTRIPSLFVRAREVVTEDDLTAAILLAMGLRHDVGQAVTSEIARAFGNSRTIVVLDDLAAFDDAEGALLRLLDNSAGLQLVVTGRAPIGVADCTSHRLDAFSISTLDAADPHAMADHPAVALFSDRAIEVDPTFRLDATTASTVAAICRRTGGVALAIELTASRLALMSPSSLLAELDRSSVLGLVGGALRDSIERSWALLTPDQRTLLASMSVLIGPATLETIQAVSGRPETAATSATIDDLTRLVDLHLVDPDRHATGRARFGLPSAIAAFAREHLDRTEQSGEVMRRLVHVMASAARRDASLSMSLDRLPGNRILEDFDNTRLAIEATLRSEDVEAAFAVQFLVDTAPAFFALGESRTLSSHLVRTLDQWPTHTPAALRAVALAWLGRCESEHTYPPDRDALTRRLREVLELCPQIEDHRARLDVLATVAELLPYLTDPSVAADAATRGLCLATEIGDEARRGRFLSLSGAIAHLSGSPQRAALHAVEAIAVGVRTGDDALVARASLVLRAIDAVHRPVDAADVSMASVVERARSSGDRRLVLWALGSLGLEQVESGDPVSAARTIVELLELSDPLDYTPGRIHAVLLTTLLAASRRARRDAARMLGALSLVTAVIDNALAPTARARHRAMVDHLLRSLGEDEFGDALTEGAAMSWHDALEAARIYASSVIGASSSPQTATTRASATPDGSDSLTARELDVLQLLATGATNKAIAAELGLRPKTVMHHNESIYRKLRVRGRAAAVSSAIRSGLLDDR
jgi:predicted ATPase/DNA-binding CsgD family transcriptional regulator